MSRDARIYAAQVLGVALVYLGAAKLGLSLAFASPSVTAIWAPTGIALAAILLWGYRLWPGVALGAFLANLGTGVPLYTVFGITVGNTLEALVGAYLLLRFANFRPSLERVTDVLALLVFGAGLSTMVSATIGVTSLLAGDEIAFSDIGTTWRTWWLGDMGGDLLVAPALLVAATHWPFERVRRRAIEACGLGAVVIAVAVLVFSRSSALTYLIFPPLIWAALRFRQPGAVAASLIVAGIAVPFTESDVGPYAGESPDERLLLAQTLVGVAGLTVMILAAVISERQRAEDALGYIATTLQESLRPSRLPEIPGVEVALELRPAGREHLVGGDFYDLSQNEDGTWAMVLGDVGGKGASAAAGTALARYTLREAGAHERQPSRILQLLNEAFLRQAPGDSCTVAYGRLELDGANGPRMTISIAGHPLPLVLRSDGRVEPVGRPGTMLGVLRDPDLTDHVADLAPGDALLVYTDGLTDAYAPGRIFAAADVEAALRSCAGRSAQGIADGVFHAALDGVSGEPRDDIALLVLRVLDR